LVVEAAPVGGVGLVSCDVFLAWGDDISAHKPRNTKGELRGLKEAHKASMMQTAKENIHTSHYQASVSITGQDREQKHWQ